MDVSQAERLAQSATALRASLIIILGHVNAISEIASAVSVPPVDLLPAGSQGCPCHVNRQTFSVRRGDRECVLGFTLGFRLLAKLVERPNQYISADRLTQEVWGGQRAPSTVRTVVCELRGKLNRGGMPDLAAMIDGRNPGHYGLITQASPRPPDSDPTQTRRRPDSPTRTPR